MSSSVGYTLAESPEAAKLARQADIDFELKNNIDFKQEAKKLGESLWYKPFVAPWEIPSNSPENEITNDTRKWNEKIKEISSNEHPSSPLIDRIIEDGIISPFIGESIKIDIQKRWDFKAAIKNSEIESQIQKLIIDRWTELNNKDSSLLFQKNFWKDFWKYFSQYQNEKWEFINERAKNAYDMISRNYMIGRDRSPEEQSKAVNMAFNIGINTEINGKIFTRNINFENNFKKVKDENTSITERFDAFINIINIIDTDQGAKWRRKNQEKRRAQKKAAIKAAWLEEAYTQQQRALRKAQESRDKRAIQKAQIAMQEIEENALDLSSWDIQALWWGILDTVSYWQETTEKTV